MVLFKKTELLELHDIKSLHVESYLQTDRNTRIPAAHKSTGNPKQVKDLNLGYYTAQNSASNFKNFVTEGDECAVIAKGSELKATIQIFARMELS
jgi:hypothetical protein